MRRARDVRLRQILGLGTHPVEVTDLLATATTFAVAELQGHHYMCLAERCYVQARMLGHGPMRRWWAARAMRHWVTSEEWFRLAELAAVAEARAIEIAGAGESSLGFRVELLIAEGEDRGLREERSAWEAATGTGA